MTWKRHHSAAEARAFYTWKLDNQQRFNFWQWLHQRHGGKNEMFL